MPQFPVHYRPRPYQAELHKLWRAKRYGLAVLSRQSGKDVAMSMETAESCLRTPKITTAYISLDNPMIRDILWDKTYLDPATGQYIQMLQDNVPIDLCDWKGTAMTGVFTNGSRMKLQGYFQSGRDKNGVGTSFKEYNFTELALFTREDPMPRLLPILESTPDKKLRVVSTPRGKRRNSLWQLMESLKHHPQYGQIIWGIDDLNAQMEAVGQPPILTQDQLAIISESYLKRFGNSRMFEQEYHCSFEEMDAAAVYGEAYMRMIEEGRVLKFNLNTAHPVYVVFDIGASGIHSDATSWLAFQYINGRLYLYDCGEGHGRALPEYVDELRTRPWFSMVSMIILPWDGEHHEKAINATPADMMRQKFPNVAVLAKSNKVWRLPGARVNDFSEVTDIQQTRMMLYNTVVHPELCDWVLECFENYKYEYDNKRQEWTSKPLHDRYSHMMDALRYAVQSTKELEFFGGKWFDATNGQPQKSVNYEEDWSGVWVR